MRCSVLRGRSSGLAHFISHKQPQSPSRWSSSSRQLLRLMSFWAKLVRVKMYYSALCAVILSVVLLFNTFHHVQFCILTFLQSLTEQDRGNKCLLQNKRRCSRVEKCECIVTTGVFFWGFFLNQ